MRIARATVDYLHAAVDSATGLYDFTADERFSPNEIVLVLLDDALLRGRTTTYVSTGMLVLGRGRIRFVYGIPLRRSGWKFE